MNFPLGPKVNFEQQPLQLFNKPFLSVWFRLTYLKSQDNSAELIWSYDEVFNEKVHLRRISSIAQLSWSYAKVYY